MGELDRTGRGDPLPSLIDRMRVAEARIETIARDQAVTAANTQNLKEAMATHGDEVKRDLGVIYQKVNGIERDQSVQLENQKTNTRTLSEISTKLDSISMDRAAILSFPRIMAWFAGIAATVTGIYQYLKMLNGGG